MHRPLTPEQRRLAEEHVPLAYHIAGRRIYRLWKERRLPRFVRQRLAEDLVSAAVLGLLAGVRGFDPEKGYRFSSYAGRCMETAMADALRRKRFHGWSRRLNGVSEPRMVSLPVSRWEFDEIDPGFERIDLDLNEETPPPGWDLEAAEEFDRLCRMVPRGHGTALRLIYKEEVLTNHVGPRLGLSRARGHQLHHEALSFLREALGVTATATVPKLKPKPEPKRA